MKRKFITSMFALALTAGAFAQSPTQADFNRAVMQAYEEMLRENYKDYETLFRRAHTLYTGGDYMRALDDLDKALKYAPASDTDTRFSIYALRAECFRALKRYSQALAEANEALKIDPMSTAMLNLRGEIAYDLGQYDTAKADFSKLLRIQPRSQEAFYGLALVAVKENNLGLADDYMQKAIALTPSDSRVYVRSAKVKQAAGSHDDAVAYLLRAIATDSNDSEALPALVELANSNYAAVNAGLTSAINRQPRQPLYYFLRGSIAAAHNHYVPAIEDFSYIVDENLYEMSSLYSSLAECYYALGKYETALEKIDMAITKLEQNDDACLYYTVRSRILRATGNFDKAKTSIDRALDFSPENVEATVEKALVLTSLKEAAEASALLGEVVMSNPYEPMNYLTRAWVLNDFLNQPKAAKALYGRVIGLELDHSERIGSMLGFAQLFDGKTAAATAWIDAILAEPDYDGTNHYYGACFYAWAGKTDKALDCMEKSLKAGYADYHNWTAESDSRVNVLPIRDTPRFKALLEQYKSLFEI